MQRVDHDLIILGTGLAGLRAALEAKRVTKGEIDIALVTKGRVFQSNSVAAEAGIAAVLREGEGDSFENHCEDTLRAAAGLADRPAVEKLVEYAPEEVRLLAYWGCPWARREDGLIAQRHLGGHRQPRVAFAGDRTGLVVVRCLYDQLQRYWDGITFYEDCVALELLLDNGIFAGLTALHLASGEEMLLAGRALIIAGGGAGRLYGFTTCGPGATGDGLALAYRAGIPLRDMEFVQFHPTALVPSGVMVTEAARAEGAILLNANGERFLPVYDRRAELAPRDVVCRAMVAETRAGRAAPGPDGLPHFWLDLRHLPPERLAARLPQLARLARERLGLDLQRELLPVRPAAHYTMGGIAVDDNGATSIPGIWAVGEAACVSVHGANRLGGNSLAECLVWGRVAGREAATYARRQKRGVYLLRARGERLKRLSGSTRGRVKLSELRAELGKLMDQLAGIIREATGLRAAQTRLGLLKESLREVQVGRERVYNLRLLRYLELENLLDLGQVLVAAALAREESRGSHLRDDFPAPDDEGWRCHTLATWSEEGPALAYEAVKG